MLRTPGTGRDWRWKAALAAWGLALACGLPAAQAQQRLLSPLVAPAELERLHQGDAPPLVLDASSAADHRKARIPGAVHLDYFSYGLRDGQAAERARWLQSLGLGGGRRVVVYDQGGSWLAPRLFHELVYSGLAEDRILLLDGGLARWRSEGRPVAEGAASPASPAPAPAAAPPAPGALREELRVRLPEFLLASGDPRRHALVDALGPEHYFGAARFFDRGGHVPNAVNWPAEDFFDPATKAFRPPAEIRRMAAWLGVSPEQTVHTHCGGGGAAAVPWFALRYLAGYPRVTLYRESQQEWLRDERGLPFWTLARPNLQRPATWLATWAGPMMRAIGASRIAVVDVRPADAYALGHIPQALNLPAEDLAAATRDPAALARRLAAAGVDPAHEAVVVGDGGLNPRTALAMLALERAGQARVSFLAESVDEWGLRGHPLTKDPPTPAPASARTEPRPGPALAAAEAGRTATGPHPRQRLVVGEGAAAADAGRVAVGQLVGPDGALKPASELWKVLAQAGVKRYGETVVSAEAPGDAALAWVVLRALGFEEVTVALP